EALGPLFDKARERLAALGFVSRKERLRQARHGRLECPRHIVMDGFFSLSPEELDLTVALAEVTEMTVVLPESSAAHLSRTRLIRGGFTERRFDRPLRQPQTFSF